MAWNTPGLTTWKPSPASAFRKTGKPGKMERRLGTQRMMANLCPNQGGKLKILANIFANPICLQIDDYYEPFTFDYEHLQNAPEMQTPPTARPVSVLTGKKMDKIEWGPNWEDDFGGEFAQ
jgi:nitrate reductase beta subunit